MQLTEKQQNKVRKIAKVIDNGNVGIANILLEMEDRLEDLKSCVENNHSIALEQLSGIQMPEIKDYDEKLEALREKLDEEDEITVELNII